MSDATQQLYAIKLYLRRLYGAATAPNKAALIALSLAAFSEVTETVEITGTASELGSTSGIVKFDKATLMQACEELLLEIWPDDYAPPPPTATVIDFSSRPVST